MSYPEMMAVPLVGDVSPIKMLNVVVLPAPEHHKKTFTNEGIMHSKCIAIDLF